MFLESLKRAARKLKDGKRIFIFNTLVAKQRVYSNPGTDLQQALGKNEIAIKFTQNTSQNFFRIVQLKNTKMWHLLQKH